MDIKKLSTGASFHTTGAGNVGRQMSALTLPGSKFHNLSGYKKDIIKALAEKATLIRRGNFGYLTQRKVIKEVKDAAVQERKPLTISETRNLKEIAKYYGDDQAGQEAPSEESAAAAKLKVKMEEREALKESLEAKQSDRQPNQSNQSNQPTQSNQPAQLNSSSQPNQSDRPRKIVARINRAPVAATDHQFSPYNRDSRAASLHNLNRSASVDQARRRVSTGLSSNYGRNPANTGVAGGRSAAPDNSRPNRPGTPPPPLMLEF